MGMIFFVLGSLHSGEKFIDIDFEEKEINNFIWSKMYGPLLAHAKYLFGKRSYIIEDSLALIIVSTNRSESVEYGSLVKEYPLLKLDESMSKTKNVLSILQDYNGSLYSDKYAAYQALAERKKTFSILVALIFDENFFKLSFEIRNSVAGC